MRGITEPERALLAEVVEMSARPMPSRLMTPTEVSTAEALAAAGRLAWRWMDSDVRQPVPTRFSHLALRLPP